MSAIVDAFWRAASYCLHPRVILLSLAPLLIAGGATAALGYAYWETAVAAVRAALEQWALVATFMQWLDSIGAQTLHVLVAPMILVALGVPLVVLASLLLVALLMTPAVVDLVALRRFSDLERKHGGGWFQSLFWSLACTLVALLALILSIPLWFVPPLVLLLPPLIWGWLTYRVFAFDALAAHASAPERRQILREQRWPLLVMGVISGYLGAAPSLLWAASAATLIFAPVLAVVSVWLYTLVFAFAACWFTHFLLAALQRLRRDAPLPPPQTAVPAVTPPGVTVLPPP